MKNSNAQVFQATDFTWCLLSPSVAVKAVLKVFSVQLKSIKQVRASPNASAALIHVPVPAVSGKAHLPGFAQAQVQPWEIMLLRQALSSSFLLELQNSSLSPLLRSLSFAFEQHSCVWSLSWMLARITAWFCYILQGVLGVYVPSPTSTHTPRGCWFSL